MKRKMVAIATLAAGAASAQSTLTLFGGVDTAISYYDAKSSFYTNNPSAAPFGSAVRSKWAVSSGGNYGSRLGFRGTEDLGGGLAASFWLEAGLSTDTGSSTIAGGGFGFNRRSTVSLSGGFGEIRLGRDFTPTYINDLVADPWVNSGVGATLLGAVGTSLATLRGPGSATSASDNYTRSNNSIGYFLPRNLGGFYGQLMYGLPETTKVNGVPGSPSAAGRYYGGRFGYTSGPFDIALAYGASQAVDGLVGPFWVNNEIVTTSLSATYDFGAAQLFGQLMQLKDKREASSPLNPNGNSLSKATDNYDGALVGVAVPVGPGLIRATYAKVKFNYGGAFPTLPASSIIGDSSSQKLSLGYIYNFSKRTALYATVAKIQISQGQNNPAFMGSTTGGSLTYQSTGGGIQGYAPRSSIGYDFGIRTTF